MRRVGRGPFIQSQSRRTTQIGMVETRSAVMLEVSNRSAQQTMPFPPSIMNAPTIVASRHWRLFARPCPCSASQATIRSPAMKYRAPAMRKGGMVDTAKRIAR